MTKFTQFLISLIVLISACVWIAVLTYPASSLKIIACNVGQGDAILIIKDTKQILVDGGANNRVLDCLGKYVPFWDRTIELVVVTHPDKDHYFGVIEVLNQYKVETLVSNKVDKEGSDYEAFKKNALLEDAKIINPYVGLKLKVSDIYLNFLWPDEGFVNQSESSIATSENGSVLGAYTSKANVNDFSAVFNLTYGSFDALFTGDIGPKISDELATRGYISDVEYLKVPHHGSKNGLTKALVEAASPELSIISLGKNSYGHPHSEVLQLLLERNSKVSRTDIDGDVIIETDGERWKELP